MENKMELTTERPSLLILNEYCFLEIFEFLQLDDSMNLAECCNRLRRVADRAIKIKSKFKLNGSMFELGDNYIDRVLAHISHSVSWLTINCLDVSPNLSKIISDCNNLKSLQICDWYEDECQVDSTLHNFDKIELVSLYECDLGNLKMFLKNFYKLKYLTIYECWNNDEELIEVLLKNNPEIESFCFKHEHPTGIDNEFRIFQLLERIPKLKSLGFKISRTLMTTELNPLLTLNGLTKLKLDCKKRVNINNVLSELARKGIMEEIQLRNVEMDNNFFDILKSFVRLQLLDIVAINLKLKSSTIWPTNLKRLRLENIEFTHHSFISTIQQLKSLECMDIQWCTIAESDVADFKNVAKLSQNILNVMDHGNRKHRLEVVFLHDLFEEDHSKTHLLVDSKRLRILHSAKYNAFRIQIQFPGLGRAK